MSFRLDRALTLALGHPVARALNGLGGLRIPVLMYHGISEEVGTKHPYFETNTSPEIFRHHMRFLHEKDYQTVDLKSAHEALAGSSCDKEQQLVAITFDDGYRDFYIQAFPILARYGFNATVFIVSGFTRKGGLRREGKDYMSWEQVREAHSYGISIGSHTASHPELVRLSRPQVEREVKESKKAIEDELGSAVTSFAYPFAFPEQAKGFVRMLRGLLETSGYANGVSTIIGTACQGHDKFFLPRVPVNSHDDLRFFQAKLDGGYDWLRYGQTVYKRLSKRPAGELGFNTAVHLGGGQ